MQLPQETIVALPMAAAIFVFFWALDRVRKERRVRSTDPPLARATPRELVERLLKPAAENLSQRRRVAGKPTLTEDLARAGLNITAPEYLLIRIGAVARGERDHPRHLGRGRAERVASAHQQPRPRIHRDRDPAARAGRRQPRRGPRQHLRHAARPAADQARHERPHGAVARVGEHHHRPADPARAGSLHLRARLLRADDEHVGGLRDARVRRLHDPDRQPDHPAHDRTRGLMLQVAVAAGLICGGIVVAYFIAIDQFRAAAANGHVVGSGPRPTFVKQLESLLRPVAKLPARTAGQLRQKLSQAGNPAGLTPAGFQAVRYSLGALLAVVGLAMGLLVPLGVQDYLAAPLAGAVFAAIGYMAPILWLEQRIGQRRHQIQRSLAEATDLLTLVVESGMSLDEGLLSITERFHNALGDEIGKVLRVIRLGRPRMAALEHMADTCGVADLHHLVESIVQSDQMGVPIARLLRVQATEMRRRQRQTAQERAAQASSRMVFPMVGCIFPVLWIVLLGPAIIQILGTLR